MNREVLPDGTVLYSTPLGTNVVQRLAPGVLLLTAIGELGGADPNGPMQDMEREIAQNGSLVLVMNMLERKSVASSSRKQWTAWTEKHRGKIRSHVLVRSKLVAMAIGVMAMLSGGVPLETYAEVADLERALGRIVPGLKRLPPLPAKARAILSAAG